MEGRCFSPLGQILDTAGEHAQKGPAALVQLLEYIYQFEGGLLYHSRKGGRASTLINTCRTQGIIASRRLKGRSGKALSSYFILLQLKRGGVAKAKGEGDLKIVRV